jgi:regulatory protein
MKQITYEQALHRIAAYCSRSERCVSDVRKKLDAWEMSAGEQEKIIQKLCRERFLDESRYCRAFVNDKFKYSRWGAYKIRFELKKKKISEELIQEALQNIDPDENSEQLQQLIEQKKKSVKGRNEYEIRQKLMRFAVSRGFTAGEIEKALKWEM